MSPGESFNRLDPRPSKPGGSTDAGANSSIVDNDSASSTVSPAAAILGACQTEFVTKHLQECRLRRHLESVNGLVDAQSDGFPIHAVLPPSTPSQRSPGVA